MPITETKMCMGRTLLILLWKHFTVRARRFINTPVEYFSPILLFIFLFSFKDKINPVQRTRFMQEYDLIQYTEPSFLEDIARRHGAAGAVVYFPNNNLTDLIMSKALESMNLKSTDVKGSFYDLSAVDEYVKTMGPDDALVIFENMTGPHLPKRLNYTIRMKDHFETHVYKAMHENLEPHSRFGSIYYPFIRLQWAIDSSYIELQTGEPITQRVSVQEFPFVKSKGSGNIDLICKVLTLTCFFSLLLVFVFLMARLQEERVSGIQELMKMVGVSTKTIGLSHFLNVLPGGLLFSIVGAVLLTATSNPLITNSNPLIIGMMLLLYFVSVISMAFAFSYATKVSQYAVSLAVFVYVALWMPAHLLSGYRMHRKLVLLTGILPHMPLVWFWDELRILEQYGYGVTFSTMFKSHTPLTASVFVSFVFMLLQATICFTITWYLSLVCPGHYGNALPWNFLFKGDYWRKNEVIPDAEGEPQERLRITAEPKYFEDPPMNHDVGIEISNVSKVFDRQRVLNNVSFNVLKGEITVLLGHNGAGKTTLMSIITGMLSSEGTVRVNGKDTSSYRNDVRKQVGFCPQHNLFFNDLTVLEHVKFFSLLKNVPWREVNNSSKALLNSLELGDKMNVQSTALSGGMKRRLQLACALAGDANVLILDEPTSGLDVETRRGLWNLLLTLREGKAVLLSTHFMEEADALGSRVAALHRGELRCFATPMHLKKEIDTGYRLSLTLCDSGKTGSEKEAELKNYEYSIKKVLTEFIPKAVQLKESGQNAISFSLPAKDSSMFPQLFGALESKKDVLGIQSFGVGISTLEEVFLRLCSDVSAVNFDDESDAVLRDQMFGMKPKVRGIHLCARQFWALIKRQFHYLMSKKYAFFALQVFLPILMICLFTRALNGPKVEEKPKNSPLDMSTNLYQDIDRRALANIDLTGIRKDVNIGGHYEPSYDVAENLIDIAKKDKLEYNKYVIGIELNNTDAKALYTTLVRHAAPVAMNALSNAIAASKLPWADGNIITTTNHPIDESREVYRLKEPKDLIMAVMWGIVISFLIQATCVNSVTLPCTERLTGTRHLHVMAGCPPALHWLATLFTHGALGIILLVVPAVLAAHFIDTDSTLNTPTVAGALLVVLILGSLAFLAFSFLMSFGFGDRAATGILIAIIIMFGFITPLIKTASDMLTENPAQDFWYYLLLVIEYTIPSNTFTIAAMKTTNVARLNAYCHLNKDKCPNLMVPEKGFDAHKCCTFNMEPRSYYTFDEYSPAFGMVCLALQCVVYMILVLLAQRGVFNMIRDRLYNSRYRPPPPPYYDEMLEKEKNYVNQHIDHIDSGEKDALLVSSVNKRYRNIFGKACEAVKGISFAIHKGECFGLVGVNGAGKSTTFKMLTCEEFPTRGRIVNNNHPQKFYDNDKYLQSLGYCPQFFGLDYFLTGRQNLALMLTLNGLCSEDVNKETDTWLELVDLKKYADLPVSSYSGGCARRLGTAAALLRRAPLALLDEPTAGVDVGARRHVWRAIRCARRGAVLITSHSMDEMEALCSRIGIMSGGRVVALDSPAGLRAAHSAGHAVSIKIRQQTEDDRQDEVDGQNSQLKDSKLEDLKRTFGEMRWTFKDQHKTMVHYHIKKDMNMRYSELFSKLEALKEQYKDLIEDYIVTETTLEQVFLTYAAKAPTFDPAKDSIV